MEPNGFLNITIEPKILEIDSSVNYHMANWIGEIGVKNFRI